METPKEVVVEKITFIRNKRKINRIHALLVFKNPITESEAETLLCIFARGHIYNTLYTSIYMWFLKVYYKAYYMFPDRKRLLIIFAQPKGERFSRYGLGIQIEEVCSLIDKHLIIR